MNPQIKPIETHYKGYRFRSRLEARWAVFFDALGLEWQYEPEGFNLTSGSYLPDFWLPQMRLFIEVKPYHAAANEGHLKAMRDSGHPILLLIGYPGENNGILYCYSLSDGGGATSNVEVYFSLLGQSLVLSTEVCLEFYPDHLFSDRMEYVFANVHRRGLDEIEMATRLARSARFEHGEQPNIGFKARTIGKLSDYEKLKPDLPPWDRFRGAQVASHGGPS